MDLGLINLSTLNDYVFCPYSIYLHSVYQGADKTLYQAKPQTKGTASHQTVDQKGYVGERGDECSLEVCSVELGIMGKIDIFRPKEKKLIERKYQIKQLYRGQYYQLWGQYFCMIEMGYEIEHLAFYVIKTKTFIEVDLPTEKELEELKKCVSNIRNIDLECGFTPNPNKCLHCIYSNLCDKTQTMENVYQ